MSEAFQLLDTPLEAGVTLLEASAGTGKTYALAAIYLRLIAEEGLTVGQIAVTTYTIPATEELRERIRARLAEAVAVFDGAPAETPFVAELIARHEGEKSVRQRLADATRDFDEACISTIHGFCQRILRERSFESGASPDAELAPDQSALIREVAEDFWRHHFAPLGSAGTPLALLTGLKPEHLASLWKSAASQPTAILVPEPGAWKEAQAKCAALLAELQAQWPGWSQVVRRLFVDSPNWAISSWKDTANNAAQLELVSRLAADLQAPLPCYQALAHFQPSVISKKRGISTNKAKPLPAFAFGEWCERLAEAAGRFAAAVRSQFLHWARTELAQRKAARGEMSFDDLLIRLHAALHGPSAEALATAVRERFRASLVDEFQDTDPIQEAIFRRLFADDPAHRLFLIGDPKQAIYGFRGADLHTYLAARHRAARVFLLDTNFRSDEALVRAVNALFLRPAAPFIEDIEYPEIKAARAPDVRKFAVEGQVRAPMRFAFWQEEKAIGTTQANHVLPRVTANSIAGLLAASTLDSQPLRPSHIAVLCWNNRQCQAVQAALSELRIPAVVLSNASVFSSPEARELLLLLAALCRPSHEAAVRTALTTSLFGLDAAALEALGEDTLRWEEELTRFAAAHARWRDRGFIQMFRELLRDTAARTRLLALPGGERRLTNFLHLAEVLHSAAREFSLDPAALQRWLATAVAHPASAEEHELRLESDDEAVKVLTIHKSKGLEWPVVFCPFLWTKADLWDEVQTLFHGEDGRAVLDLGSPARDAARAAAAGERLAENLRLVYVALTRARHECHVIWGQFNGCETSALMWLLESPGRPAPTAPAAVPPAERPSTAEAATMLARDAKMLDAAHLHATIQTFANALPHFISVEELTRDPAPGSAPNTALPAPTPKLEARTFSTPIDRTWRVSSFSSLTAGAEEAHDHDQDDRPRLVEADLRGIHAFPRGNRAGICLHEIFEDLEFTDDSAIDPLVKEKLQQHALHTDERAAVLAQCVRHTLAAPLGGTSLNQVPRKRTLREMEFQLPARLLTPGQLAEAAGAGLQFEPRRGILTGYIDLIFEHEGRYSVVDWKSNHLGANEEAYHTAALAIAMERHRYHLQWRIYTLALHRFLKARLPDYSAERHLGGVYYLFLRGLTPGRSELGIFHTTPTAVEIAQLEQTFLL